LNLPFVFLQGFNLDTFALTYRTWVFWDGEQDFYNLVDVYPDAVFHPCCVDEVHTFQQEGWHYELNDPYEYITYKGKKAACGTQLFCCCLQFFFFL
jgi:hypothetical protein